MKCFILLICVFTLAHGGPTPVNNEDSVSKLVVGTFVNCMNSDLSLCLKEHALKAAERISAVRKLRITDGLTIINNGSPKEGKSLEPLSSELEVRRQQVTQRLWDSTSDLLQNADLEYSYADDAEESRSIGDVEEGRGKKKEKKKKLKLLISLAILGKIKAIILAIVSLVVIAVSLAKLAFLAKIAFIVKAIAIIKALLAKKHQQEESWVVPHHEEHSSHGWDSGASAGHGWSRSSDAQALAYSAHQK